MPCVGAYTLSGMTWWDYVEHTAPGALQKEIAVDAGVDQSTVSRWKKGGAPDPEGVITFARTRGRSPVEALLAAGLITELEAKAKPRAPINLDEITDEQLLELLRRRLAERSGDVSDPGLSVVSRVARKRQDPKKK